MRNVDTTSRERSATERLVEAAQSVAAQPLPQHVLDRAKLCVLDLVGVALAGSVTNTAAIVREVVAAEFGAGPAVVWGTGLHASPTGAALANGTAAHALDYDDVISGSGHPSTVVVPAALAAAGSCGVDGDRLLRAVVAGLETHTALGEAIGPSHYRRGFHSTATLGAFSATAAAGTLRELDATQLRAAFGLAGTQAAGLKSMFGTMGKPLHAGKAAANGVLAAALADGGFTAAEDVLGVAQGFADTQSDALDAELIRPPAEDIWRTLDIQFKMHAACYLTHASIEALRDLQHDGTVVADDVEHIRIAVPPGHLHVCAIPTPTTGLEGKFSLAYTAALALLDDSTGPQSFTDDLVRRSTATALAEKVETVADPVLDGPVARVSVTQRGARTVDAFRDMHRVAAERDRDALADRLVAKFLDNVVPVLGADRAQDLLEATLTLEKSPDVRDYVALSVPADAR